MGFRSVITLLTVMAVAVRATPPQDIESRMVNLNLIAVDGRGQAVDDLSEDDIRVTDAGKPQRIVFFRHNDSKSWFPPDLGPNETSNRKADDIPY